MYIYVCIAIMLPIYLASVYDPLFYLTIVTLAICSISIFTWLTLTVESILNFGKTYNFVTFKFSGDLSLSLVSGDLSDELSLISLSLSALYSCSLCLEVLNCLGVNLLQFIHV